ncbi:ATP-binding cassette domain-containing protein [Bradyrhizobium hipponense]|uniref:ATP-binding cassette domain-containing protein n=1 Tax=Bradyrhizobium hipponense TaxID=2605638 RepID=A0A5S4YLW1_9BRAD|nr:ATP-binding cassette domain-containing protein [Bradyrhizobium hipponense]
MDRPGVAVDLRDVMVRFGDFTAVKSMNLQVGETEFVAVVGPTGCGKSTILNTVTGLLKPAAGDVRIFGKSLTGLNDQSGYMLQQEGLLPWKTAQDNVGLRLVFQGSSIAKAREQAKPWLAKVGLKGFEERYPNQLSGGQRKRVAMAQTLIMEPKIVLMDEPFSALDVHTRRLMHRILLDLWQADRRSLVFIAHDLDEAITMADRVVVVADVRITLPRPRDVSALQTTDEFVALYREIWSLLGAEVEKSYATRGKVALTQFVIVLGVILIWELGVRAGLIDPFFFPAPSTLVRIGEWMSTADFWTDVGITLLETVLSFLVGIGIGTALGIWLGLSPFAAEVVQPFIKMFNAIPRILLGPIFVIWFGLGPTSKVALGVTLVLFVAFFNTFQGVREVNPVVLANARLLRASKSSLLRHVYLPSATTWILSSLRVSVGMAVMGSVVAEYLGSSAGLGHLIAQAEGVLDATGVFAGIIVLSAFVVALDAIVDRAEKRLLVWRPALAQES